MLGKFHKQTNKQNNTHNKSIRTNKSPTFYMLSDFSIVELAPCPMWKLRLHKKGPRHWRLTWDTVLELAGNNLR